MFFYPFNLSFNAIPLSWDGKFECFKFRAFKFATCNLHMIENQNEKIDLYILNIKFTILTLSEDAFRFSRKLIQTILTLSEDWENLTLRKNSVQ